MTARFVLLLCALVASFALAACGDDNGGGSANENDVADTINRVFTSDDPDKCTEAQTPRFTEQTHLSQGESAVTLCRQDAGTGIADSVDVSAIEVSGDKASAEVATSGSTLDGQTLKVELVKDGEAWKLDRLVGFVNFDRDTFDAALADSLENEEGFSAEGVKCLEAQYGKLSDQEIEDIFTSGDPKKYGAVLGPCFVAASGG
jgi:hypothetical protein